MTEGARSTSGSLLTAVAALAVGLALAGTSCSGEDGSDGAEADGRGARQTRTTTGADSAAGLGAGAADPDAGPARLATAEFDVEGMTCGGCALATEMAVEELDGVASADAEYDEATGEGRCTVEYDPSEVGADRIAAAIEEAGFRPRLRQSGSR